MKTKLSLILALIMIFSLFPATNDVGTTALAAAPAGTPVYSPIANPPADNTDITAKFTDSAFRASVLREIGSETPATKITYGDVKNMRDVYAEDQVKSLAGIEYFTNLRSFAIYNTDITSAVFSGFSKLEYFEVCENYKLTYLAFEKTELSKNRVVRDYDSQEDTADYDGASCYLEIYGNDALTTLVISEITAGTYTKQDQPYRDFYGEGRENVTLTNQHGDVGVSVFIEGCDALTNISITDCAVGGESVEIESLPKLTNLTIKNLTGGIDYYTIKDTNNGTKTYDCKNGNFYGFFVDNCNSLQSAQIENVSNLVGEGEEWFYDCNALKSVKISGISTVENYKFYYWLGTAFVEDEDVWFGFDIENCKSLETVEIKNSSDLTYLHLINNNLTTIDVSSLVNLRYLNVGGNQLKTIDVSKNTLLEELVIGEETTNTRWVWNENTMTGDEIEETYIYRNKISQLDISKNMKLEYLDVRRNNFFSKDDIIGLDENVVELKFDPQDLALCMSTTNSMYYIDLTAEKLNVGDFKIAAYSLDDGLKWKTGIPNIKKLLDKGFMLWITDSYSNVKNDLQLGQTIKFPEIAKRPKTPAVKPFYNENETYELKDKDGTAVSGLNISGGDVLTAKQKINVYLLPVASGNTYSAASKPKKVGILALGKAQKAVVDYKKETIKLKKGQILRIGNERIEAGSAAKVVEISTYLATYPVRAELWTAATGKKPPTVHTKFTLLTRKVIEARTLTAFNGKLTLPTGYEAKLGAKWSKTITETSNTTLPIRIAPTAKKSGNGYTGNAASAEGKIEIVVGKYGSGKNEKTGIISAEIKG
ncbi:hypothetical protein FACS18949_13730 [Clostridia bacterium]|nr:hypothetical protein FACS189425_02590 [Clostridia bacterium]GHV35547.1 hypothetical protein FACS18949_13730 [Clostridia bacterium]